MSNDLRKLFQAGSGRAVLLFLFLISIVSTAWAGWQPEGVPVCVAEGYQASLVATPDNLGGMIFVWQDQRAGSLRVYSQAIDKNGNLLWEENGTPLNESGSQQFNPWICSDGTGGAWVVWNDRTGGYGSIYVQRLDSSGEPNWAPVGGQSIATGSGWADNSLPVCASDGLGGVIVAWVQEINPPSGDYQVVAQRIDSGGTITWTPGGIVAGDDIGANEELDITTNLGQSYGVFLSWVRSNSTGAAQWVDLAGTTRWNGVFGENFGIVTPGSRVRIADRSRSSQGAYVMYCDRGGLNNLERLRIASMDSSTYLFWDEVIDIENFNGSSTVGNDYRVMDNGLNGVYCVWDRVDVSGDGLGIFSCNLDYDGDKLWGGNNTQVSTDTDGNYLLDAAVDWGSWNVLVAWIDKGETPPRVKYNYVLQGYGWTGTEVLVPGGYSSERPIIVAEHMLDANPLIAWVDERAVSETDIYAAGLKPYGNPLHPNLVSTEMTPDSQYGTVGGGLCSFYVKVKNTGTSQADSFWTTIFPDQVLPPSIGDTPPPEVQSVHYSPLDNGDSVLVEILIDAPGTPQTWTMWGFADFEGDVEEFGEESDNIIGPIIYEWVEMSDLTIANVEFSDTEPEVGGSITATIKVKNIGFANADSFHVDFYEDLSSPPVIGQLGSQRYLVFNLAAGDSISWEIDPVSNADAEVWTSYFQVDTDGWNNEESEDNNISGPHTIEWQLAPRENWPVAAGGDFHSSPALAKIDNDPMTLEVVVGNDDGYLYAFTPDGNPAPGWPVNLGQEIYSSPAVGDICGDYRMEVVVGCQDGYIYAFDNTGNELWNKNLKYPVENTPALADLDDDGKLEVIISVSSGTFGSVLLVLEGDGSDYSGLWPLSFSGPDISSAAVGDMDNDGSFEISVAVSGFTTPIIHSLIYLLDESGGNYSVNWPVQLDTFVVASPVMGDIESVPAGELELVICALSGQICAIDLAGTGVWTKSCEVHSYIEKSPALIDIDKDGLHEIAVSSRYWDGSIPPFGLWVGVVTFIDNNGKIFAGWPNSTGHWFGPTNQDAVPSPVSAKSMVYCGSPANNLYCWEGSPGDLKDGFPLNLHGDILSSAAIGDLDMDGCLEFVAGSSDDSLYCYELWTGTLEANKNWPMFRNGRTRTGCFYVETVTDVEEDEDASPLLTRLVSIYPNPFNPSTRIFFDLDKKTMVNLTIYDVRGHKVSNLVDEVLDANRHSIVWHGVNDMGKNVSSGIYFCRMTAGDIVQTKKLVLLR